MVLLDGGVSLENGYAEVTEQAKDVRDSGIEKGELPPGIAPALPEWKEVERALEQSGSVVRLEGWERAGESGAVMMGFTPTPNFGGHLRYFLRDLRGMLEEGCRVAVVSHQAERLSELLAEVDIFTPVLTTISEAPAPGSVKLVQGALSEGWTLKGDGKRKPLVLFTDKEIFGYVKQRRASRRRPVRKEAFASDIAVGDYVVHVDHGIGRFVGVTTMSRGRGPAGVPDYRVRGRGTVVRTKRQRGPCDALHRVGGGRSSDEPAGDAGMEPGKEEGQGVGGKDCAGAIVAIREA